MNIREREAILDRMNESAYDCAGCLQACVDKGVVTLPTAVDAVKRLRAAVALYNAVNAIDKAKA